MEGTAAIGGVNFDDLPIGGSERMTIVRRPYPQEFRDDVVRVAQQRPKGGTLEEVATDFGIHPMTLSDWLRRSAEAESRMRSWRDGRCRACEARGGP